MKKLILITVCVFGLAFAGSAVNQVQTKKEPVKKEATADNKVVKKTMKTETKTVAVKPGTKKSETVAKSETTKPVKK